MAIRGRIPVDHDVAFPYGVYATGIAPLYLFEDGKRLERQEIDPETGHPVWVVTAIDADDTLPARSKTITVKIPAPVQPVLPDPVPDLPFRPVRFVGLTVTPYVMSGRVAYSYRATGVEPVPSASARKAEA